MPNDTNGGAVLSVLPVVKSVERNEVPGPFFESHITKTRIQHTAPSALSLISPLKQRSGTQIVCVPSILADW